MHFGKKNRRLRYFPKNESSIQRVLDESQFELDLSIMNSSELKRTGQVNLAVSRTNRSIGIQMV